MKKLNITIIAILLVTLFTGAASADYLTTNEATALIERSYIENHAWISDDGDFHIIYEGIRGLAYIFRIDQYRAQSINEVNNRSWLEINTLTKEILDITDEFKVNNGAFAIMLSIDYPEAEEEIREIYGHFKKSEDVKIEKAFSGDYSDAENKDVTVVRDMDTLSKITGESFDASIHSFIDFRKEMALVFHAGICPTGGYEIDVKSIRKVGNDLFVKWDVKHPEGMVMNVMTSPYLVLVVPAAEEVYFERL